MKQVNNTTEKNPNFIWDKERPNGMKSTTINKASYNGDIYSWSSDHQGWFKDTPGTISGFTPGKWNVLMGNGTHFATINKDVMTRICTIDVGEIGQYNGLAPIKEAEANARLIAAAPDLLRENEELKNRVKELEDSAIIDMAFNPLKQENEELKKALRCFVEAVDIIVEANGSMNEDRRQVYVSIQKSLTYQQAKELLNRK